MTGFEVCRFHGARGGAPTGSRNGRFVDGRRTREMIELRRLIRAMAAAAQEAADLSPALAVGRPVATSEL